MSDVLRLLLQHGYLVVFGVVLLENLGLPVPGIVVLIVGGAFAAAGRLSLGFVVTLAVLGALLGDLAWYGLGRWRGRPVLSFLCKLSLNPDTCVGTTERFFLRYGMPTLILAKFLPGVNTVTPPLLGILRTRFVPFLTYDLAGTLFYTAVAVGLGYVVGVEVVHQAQAAASQTGVWLGWATLALVLIYIGCRIGVRFKVRRALKSVGLTPEALRRRQAGENSLLVLDMRTPLAIRERPERIPGALQAGYDELDRVAETLPRGHTIVTYCV
ncbi:MAG TPA: VTT domain-containing protein [Candidatus Methylomirabilis sp.]|nr:VTT domain-containing protein [Candidatus Methylomirabilis sp.]HSC69887.1 VTT domain-containing protein [Candidatus Methylomirabilis sp.]